MKKDARLDGPLMRSSKRLLMCSRNRRLGNTQVVPYYCFPYVICSMKLLSKRDRNKSILQLPILSVRPPFSLPQLSCYVAICQTKKSPPFFKDSTPNYIHCWWECPKMTLFWSQIHNIINDMVGCRLHNLAHIMQLHLWSEKEVPADKEHIVMIRLSLAKSEVAATWKLATAPNISSWFDRIWKSFILSTLFSGAPVSAQNTEVS